MKGLELLSLLFIDSNGNKNYGLALATGKYRSKTTAKEQDAYLIIFMCPDRDCIFSLYYVDFAGKYLGHSSIYPEEDSIDYVLLEAWMKFNILPHYWILAEEFNRSLIVKEPESIYQSTYARLREVISRFRWAEINKVTTRGQFDRLNEGEVTKYESEKSFYPNIPSKVLTPLTL